MPITAIGAYEVVVRKGGETVAFHKQPILYIPLFRIVILVLLTLGSVFAYLRTRPHVRLHAAWLLTVPVGLAAAIGALAPSQYGSISGSHSYIEVVLFLRDFAPQAVSQLLALSAVLAVTTAFTGRARILCFLAGWGINGLALLVPVAVGGFFVYEPRWFLWSLAGILTRHTGTALGLVAVRNQFSPRRLLLGILTAWAAITICWIPVAAKVFRNPYYAVSTGTWVKDIIQSDVLYLLGFWLFVAFSPWWRTRSLRAYGIGQSRPSTDDSGPEKPVVPPSQPASPTG